MRRGGAAISDDETTAVMARGLVDPVYLRRLLERPQGRVAAALDAARLALFAGFITKVRYNNDLFDHLPGTIAVLRLHGVELAVFRDLFLSGSSRSKDKAEKVALALRHIERFAATRGGRRATGLADVVAHERAHWELRCAIATWRAPEVAGRPTFTGPVRVLRTTWDPWAVMDAAMAGRAPQRDHHRPTRRLYWADARAREIRDVDIDRPTAAVVELIDGRRSLAAITAALRRRRIAGARVTAIVASLAAGGALIGAAGAPP